MKKNASVMNSEDLKDHRNQMFRLKPKSYPLLFVKVLVSFTLVQILCLLGIFVLF